jgi:predicted GIY-YIG superfamily endonuclease
MHFTYVLESADKQHWYFGVANDVKRRLVEHNTGKNIHTNKFKPWVLRLCVTFQERKRAEEFESYLKSHSGRAFMKKHLHELAYPFHTTSHCM